MELFINYSPVSGLSINSFRNNGYYNSNVVGLVEDIRTGCASCCPLEGALDALNDGSLWEGKDQEIIEEVAERIKSIDLQEKKP